MSEEGKRELRMRTRQIGKLRWEVLRRAEEWEAEKAILPLAEQVGPEALDGHGAGVLKTRIAASHERARAATEVLDAHYGLLGVPAPWAGQTHLSRFALRLRSSAASVKAGMMYVALNRMCLPLRVVRYFESDPAALPILTSVALLAICACLSMIPWLAGPYVPREITVDIVRVTTEKLVEQVAYAAYFALVIGILTRLAGHLGGSGVASCGTPKVTEERW